jgi:hypothetical protein
MMRGVIRRPLLVACCLGVVALAAGCGAASTFEVTYMQYRVTCCQSSDINQVYHPGEALVVHWMVSPGWPTTSSIATTLTLSLTLQGPYASVTALKSGAAASYTLHAATLTTTDRSNRAPTSSIQLPGDLPPGFYNLTTKIAGPDSSQSGASVVQLTG